jgi:hypothetical protein
MKRLIWLCSSLIFVSACAGNQTALQNLSPPTANVAAQNQPKPAEAVQFSVERAEIKAGEASEATIKLKIAPPFHVNANPPSEKNLIPTELEFAAQNGISLEKAIYPPGELKKFAFSEKPLAVYEGEIEIRLLLKTIAAADGVQTLNGTLRFQPCDDEVCYRPQTVKIALPVKML